MNRAILPRIAGLHGLVVDLGCGTRPFARELDAVAQLCVGVDWLHSPHASRPDVVADLSRALPFRSDSVDGVVAIEVLEHLAEPAAFLAETARILRPGGDLLLSIPFQWWVHEAPWDFQRYTRYGLIHALEKAGFRDISVTATSGFWAMWVLKLNYRIARWARRRKPIRRAILPIFVPFWWAGQQLADILDRRWPDELETIGYVARAKRG